MKKFILLFLCIIYLPLLSYNFNKSSKIIILPLSGDDEVYGEKTMMYANLLMNRFSSGGYNIINREVDSLIAKEKAYQNSGDVGSVIKLGQKYETDYIIISNVSKMPGNKYVLITRMIDVKTGRIVLGYTKEHKKNFDVSYIEDVYKELDRKIAIIRFQ